MKAIRCGLWAVVLVAAGTIPRAGAQGPLAPPGAPAPTMKTLAQVEPRIAITNAPFTINRPGSYYLTTNLTSTGHGIEIITNGVVLDLMGFSLTGDGGSSDYGIRILGTNVAPVNGLAVCNGSVRNFGVGIRANDCHGARFERLAISGNVQAGVWLYGSYGGCNGNVFADCAIGANAGYGFNFYGYRGACDGNVVRDCTVVGNGDAGIRLYGYGDAMYGSRCDGNSIVRCTMAGNAGGGIVLDGSNGGRCAGNRVADCTVVNNGSYGIYLNGAASGGKCQGNVVADCAIAGNSNMGLLASGNPAGTCDGNSVSGCVVSGNQDSGLHWVLARGNRVEENHVTGQIGLSYGISCVTTSSNLFLRNSCVGQINNYIPGAGDAYGPTVTNQGELATTGKPFHPWANFSR